MMLVDGFHRFNSAKRCKSHTSSALIHEGSREDALKFALSANATHGIRRTNADKRRAVELALGTFKTLTDRAIAEMCGVGRDLVGEARAQVSESDTCRPDESQSRTGLDGKKYRVKTAKV